jgi:hypothetical protein
MKKIFYFLALFLFINILNSCTPDDSVEVGIQSELDQNIAEGEEDTPIDEDKKRR